ncbi:MlaD family protein [Nocardia pseudobrasiliensis]|uniref:Virulence factor Mce-like protein n=1 Tax=Nocardia pseudobrasiliensis TaxID=45979 RepID=A0A370I110_9NOCA|nr:MlaD family protein [Nocardia pseudobrasiliensis]RDI62924.1 virulence factor Mce-like protein [Nocardia pseudobrasiliensis]
MKLGSLASLGGIVAITVLGASYLTFGVVRANPLADFTHATMVLTNSGGLAVNSPVLLTGIEVGRVSSVSNSGGGVEVGLKLAADRHVPTDSTVTIEHLSALGEPYVEFRPNSDGGPYIRDGQQLKTANVRMPLSIPEVARLATKTLNQLDPKVVGSLVSTAEQSLTGTDGAIPNLERSGDLLAAAIMSRNPKIVSLLNSFQNTAADMDWVGPSFSAAAPEWVKFTQALNELVAHVGRMVDSEPIDQYTTGNGIAPFTEKNIAALRELQPELSSLPTVLRPLIDAIVGAAPRIDISSLISQALADVDSDGAVRVRVAVK